MKQRTWHWYLGWTIFWMIVFFPIGFYYAWKTWKAYQIEKRAKEKAQQAFEREQYNLWQEQQRRAMAEKAAAARIEASRQRMEAFSKRIQARQDLLQVGEFKEYHYSNVDLRIPLDWSDRYDIDYPPAQIGDDVEVILNGDQVEAQTWDGTLLGNVVNTHADMARDFLPNGGTVLARVSYITRYKVRLDMRLYKRVGA